MTKTARLAALGAGAALTVALSGCANSEAPAEVTLPAPAPATAAPPISASPEPGVTTISDMYGPGCAQVPTEGEGSARGMVDNTVATAASNNPLLSTLTQAVQAAGLTDTLNNPAAAYTVFAPANSAFEALPAGTLDQLLADPQGRLTEILAYHVVPQRYDAERLAEQGTLTTVQGEQLVVTGEVMDLVIDQQERASVLCGNIPTANATVFVIDKVLMPPAP